MMTELLDVEDAVVIVTVPPGASVELEAPVVEPEMPATSESVREYGMTTEFKGNTPEVPDAPGIDRDALTSGDSDPVFLKLKIAQIGRTSRNGIVYDEALVKSIVEQINQKRPGGIFGHIRESERDTAFPLPHGLWVGATLVGDTAWGKAYIRDRGAASYVRHQKAVGGGLGTSIYGLGIHEQISEGVRRLKNFVLESLDFAPPERASLDMGGEFHLSREMTNEENKMPINKTDLAELTASDLYALLDESAAAGIAELHAKKQGKRMVTAEMAAGTEGLETRISELETSESKSLRELNTLRERVSEYEKTEFDAGLSAIIAKKIDWKTVDAIQEQRVNSLRTQLRNQVVAELAGKRDLTLANAKADGIMESDAFRPVAEAVRDSIAGGSAIVGGKGKSARESLYERGAQAAAEVMGSA